nr:MAG TPA: Scavenger receptor cysteine-rich domain [Caudoviricetes sp.]
MCIMAGHSRANSVLNGELKKQSPDSALNSLPPAYLQCVPCGRRNFAASVAGRLLAHL